MAIKSMSLNEVKIIGDSLFANWEATKSDVHISGTSQFRLICLKKTLQTELEKTQETMLSIAHNCGGIEQPDGTVKIPDERIPEANRALREMGEEIIDIEYSPIILRDEDSMPIELMECIADFIEIKE